MANEWREFIATLDQINKLRAALGNQQCHIEDIVRPVGMPRRDFRRRIARLTRLESKFRNDGAILLAPKSKNQPVCNTKENA